VLRKERAALEAAQAADVEQAGGGGSGGADPSGPPQWDELAEPLPLVDTADAAQFYTVLVVDAPVEEFTYRWRHRRGRTSGAADVLCSAACWRGYVLGCPPLGDPLREVPVA
jgi:hypothetical protein